MSLNKAYFYKGIKDGIPIFLGYLAVSFTFGIAAKNSGLAPIEAAVMSAANLTSAGQFSSLELIAANAPYIELIITQLIINLRYALMSASLSQKVSPRAGLPSRLLMSYGITDEIFGAANIVKGALKPAFMYGLIVISLAGWTLGTLLGEILGNALPIRLISALSVALYAMFIAIIIPPCRGSKTITVIIIISMAASGIFYVTPYLNQISSGFKIIILTASVSAAAALIRPVRENN